METMADRALNVVIAKLSEICNRPQNTNTAAVSEESICHNSNESHPTGPTAPINQVNIIGLGDSNQAIYHCTDCGYTSHNKYYLRQHLDLVHNSKRPYKCPFCDYAGKRSYALKEHLIVHSSDRPHECVHCHATFRKKGHLSNHLKMHISKLVCSLCQVTCKGRQQLLTHLHQQHSAPGRQVYACDQCLFASNENEAMLKHLEEHTQSKQTIWLKCSVCGFSCTTQSLMRTHMLENHLNQATHAEEAQPKKDIYCCSSCGFRCDDKTSMTNHMSSHLGDKPNETKENISDSSGRFTYNPESRTFACAICNYTCDQQRTIKSHIWKHSGHKDILYPMFQTVPFSLSEDKPLHKTRCDEVAESVLPSEKKADEVIVVCKIAEDNQVDSRMTLSESPGVVTFEAVAENNSQEELIEIESEQTGDIAQQAALIAEIVSAESGTGAAVTPPIDIFINSSTPSQPVRRRRASDSILAAKRPRLEEAAEIENTNDRVVVVENEHAADHDQTKLSAITEPIPESDQPDSVSDVIGMETVAGEPVEMIGRQNKRSGICSSLLAVIEQLRGNPCSEELAVGSVTEQRIRSDAKRQPKTGDELSDELAQKEKNWIWDKKHLERLSDGHYRCRLCHYQSLQFLLIAQHMKLHKIKQPFECSLCEHVAENSVALQEHMLQHCKLRTYQCKTCNATFNYKSQLRAHCRIHEKEPFSCSSCDFESASPTAFRSHLRLHAEMEEHRTATRVISGGTDSDNTDQNVSEPGNTELSVDSTQHQALPEQTAVKPSIRCKSCDFTCTQAITIQHHRNFAHNATQPESSQQVVSVDSDNGLQCSQCEFKAISTRSLKSHMKRHINDQRYVEQPLEQYKCTLCGYVCHHLPSLKSHMWRHASDTTYSYSRANDVINAAIDRDSSKGAVEENDEAFVTFRCIVCGFESTSRNKLAIHMRQHQDIIDQTLVLI